MSQVTAFQSQLRSDLNKLHPEIGADIATVKELTPETEAKLRAAIDEFKQQWASIHGEPAEVGVVA
jgi:F0F1-type ATP synthase alpha subunit